MNTDADVPQLAAKAREAYQQKRMKECVTLVNALLLADPANGEAKALQAAIQSDIQRDLKDAGALLEDSRNKENGQKYRKAAEIILLKTLNLDPTHEEAKALMSTARALSENQPAPVAAKPSTKVPLARPSPVEIPFTAAASLAVKTKEEKQGTVLKIPVVVATIVVLLGGFLLTRQPYVAGSDTLAAAPAVSTDTQPPEATPEDFFAETTIPAIAAAAAPIVNDLIAAAPPVPAPVPVPVPAPSPAKPTPVLSPPITNAVPAEGGTLAVSSPTAADIFMGEKYLGSTPATLQLPVGRLTLEYRHGDLRTAVVHDIKAKETTTALVTFDVVVQINAKPWAQVFLEGTSRRPLGQTPLSAVRVPIGSVLVFENPNFPSKSHRVTEKDAAIQMVFP